MKTVLIWTEERLKLILIFIKGIALDDFLVYLGLSFVLLHTAWRRLKSAPRLHEKYFVR